PVGSDAHAATGAGSRRRGMVVAAPHAGIFDRFRLRRDQRFMGHSAGRRKSGGYATRSPTATGRRGAEGWYLEARLRGGSGVNRIRIDKLPFRIGRGQGVDLKLASRSVSSEHAEIYWDERTAELRIRDLGSTNGTFVNNERCAQSLLTDGDIVHFADVEFRV